MALPLGVICSQSFAVFPIFGARRGEDAYGSIVARGRFMREESIMHSVEPKEAVIYHSF